MGNDSSYNGLRLATSLAKSEGTTLLVFLIGNAASCAVREQVTPCGYYNLERMLKFLVGKRAKIGVCGSCMDARGIKSETLVEGTPRSSMDELTAWTQAADRILVF